MVFWSFEARQVTIGQPRSSAEFRKVRLQGRLQIWRRKEHQQRLKGGTFPSTTNTTTNVQHHHQHLNANSLLMAALDSDQVRSLDQTRQLLLSLHTSLVALRSDISQNPQLPSWPALQTHANLISSNLQTITDSLSKYREPFSSAVVNPLPQFPGRERAFILETLLRTKLEPSIEEWVEEGETVATQQHRPAHRGLADSERDALWQWAPGAANAEARKQKWGADYTLEEKQNGIENVKTGLRRELVEPLDDEGIDDEDDEDEYEEVTDDEEEAQDKMDVEQSKPEAKPASAADKPPPPLQATQMPLTSLHKFVTTGR